MTIQSYRCQNNNNINHYNNYYRSLITGITRAVVCVIGLITILLRFSQWIRFARETYNQSDKQLTCICFFFIVCVKLKQIQFVINLAFSIYFDSFFSQFSFGSLNSCCNLHNLKLDHSFFRSAYYKNVTHAMYTNAMATCLVTHINWMSGKKHEYYSKC